MAGAVAAALLVILVGFVLVGVVAVLGTLGAPVYALLKGRRRK